LNAPRNDRDDCNAADRSDDFGQPDDASPTGLDGVGKEPASNRRGLTRTSGTSSAAVITEMEWPIEIRKLAQAVELLERALEVLDQDCYLDLCAEIQGFLRG